MYALRHVDVGHFKLLKMNNSVKSTFFLQKAVLVCFFFNPAMSTVILNKVITLSFEPQFVMHFFLLGRATRGFERDVCQIDIKASDVETNMSVEIPDLSNSSNKCKSLRQNSCSPTFSFNSRSSQDSELITKCMSSINVHVEDGGNTNVADENMLSSPLKPDVSAKYGFSQDSQMTIDPTGSSEMNKTFQLIDQNLTREARLSAADRDSVNSCITVNPTAEGSKKSADCQKDNPPCEYICNCCIIVLCIYWH